MGSFEEKKCLWQLGDENRRRVRRTGGEIWDSGAAVAASASTVRECSFVFTSRVAPASPSRALYRAEMHAEFVRGCDPPAQRKFAGAHLGEIRHCVPQTRTVDPEDDVRRTFNFVR